MSTASQLMPCLGEVHAIMRDGHFVLKSGRHTSVYVNKDAIYPHTRLVDLVTEQMAKLSPRDVDVVSSRIQCNTSSSAEVDC